MIHIEILPSPTLDVAVKVDESAVDDVDIVPTVGFVFVVGSEIVEAEATWVWLATTAKYLMILATK